MAEITDVQNTLTAVDARIDKLLEFGAQQAAREVEREKKREEAEKSREAMRAEALQDARERSDERFKFLYRLVLPALGILTGGGGGYAAYSAKAAQDAIGEVKPQQVQQTVKERADKLTEEQTKLKTEVDLMKVDMKEVKALQIDMRIDQVDNWETAFRKLDAQGGRRSRDVPLPPRFRDARVEATRLKAGMPRK